MDTFLGLTATGWTAVWTALLTVVTGALAYFVWWQVGSLRVEARQARTIAACERYDLDPVLTRATRRLGAAKHTGELGKEPAKFRYEITMVLNYLEQLAIGCKNGVYSGAILKPYMQPIFEGHIRDLIDSGAAKATSETGDPNEFTALTDLCNEWKKT